MRTLYEQLNRCKHFNGTINDKCKAGVSYEEIRTASRPFAGDEPLFRVAPCHHQDSPVQCDKREWPTDAEIRAEIDGIHESSRKIGEARKAIMDSGAKRGTAGSIPCPHCGGTLGFSIAGCSGHCHAQCSTTGCVAWME